MPFGIESSLLSERVGSIIEKNAVGISLPDDFGMGRRSFYLPDDTGQKETPGNIEIPARSFNNLNDMKHGLGMNYSEIKATKPPHSPNLAKWFDAGGSVQAGEYNGRSVWTFQDREGKAVTYIDGYPVFPSEAKHPVIEDLSIGHFTGDRFEDKKLYLEKLEEEYGLSNIPDGYALHHDAKNGNMQLVKTDWHGEFTHTGGHSLFKEAE